MATLMVLMTEMDWVLQTVKRLEQLTVRPKEMSLGQLTAVWTVMQMELMMETSSEKLMVSNWVQLTEIPKEMSLAYSLDCWMAMQMVLTKDMR